EPGSRLYIHDGGGRLIPAAALMNLRSVGSAFDSWETQVSTSRPALDHVTNSARRGQGCLEARTTDGKNGILVCREVLNTVPNVVDYVESEDSRLIVTVTQGGNSNTSFYYVAHNAPHYGDVGDLMSLRIWRQGTVTSVQVLSASLFDPQGNPRW